jgi:hypothetical protein
MHEYYDPIERKGEKAPQWRARNNGSLGWIFTFLQNILWNDFLEKNVSSSFRKNLFRKKKTCKIKIMKKNVIVFMIQKTFYKSFK